MSAIAATTLTELQIVTGPGNKSENAGEPNLVVAVRLEAARPIGSIRDEHHVVTVRRDSG